MLQIKRLVTQNQSIKFCQDNIRTQISYINLLSESIFFFFANVWCCPWNKWRVFPVQIYFNKSNNDESCIESDRLCKA